MSPLQLANADLLDRRGYLEDLFYLSSNMLQSFAFSKEHYVLGRCADVFESVFTRFGNFATVTNAKVTDETGIIQLPLWNQQIDTVAVGDTIQVENARVVTFRSERQLRVGRGGQLSVIEKCAHA